MTVLTRQLFKIIYHDINNQYLKMDERERENDMTICCSFQMYYIVYVNLNRIKMRTEKKEKKIRHKTPTPNDIK